MIRGEERVAWSCLAIMLGILGWSAGRVVPREAPPQKLPIPVDLHARVSELEARADALAKVRCLNVKADRLDVGIYPVGNVGKAPVPPPAPAAVTPP